MDDQGTNRESGGGIIMIRRAIRNRIGSTAIIAATVGLCGALWAAWRLSRWVPASLFMVFGGHSEPPAATWPLISGFLYGAVIGGVACEAVRFGIKKLRARNNLNPTT